MYIIRYRWVSIANQKTMFIKTTTKLLWWLIFTILLEVFLILYFDWKELVSIPNMCVLVHQIDARFCTESVCLAGCYSRHWTVYCDSQGICDIYQITLKKNLKSTGWINLYKSAQNIFFLYFESIIVKEAKGFIL